MQAHANLSWVLAAHALLRIASGTSGVLVGLYLGSLNNHGAHLSAGLVGMLSAVSFGAELFASIPMGIASDVFEPRWLMTGGAVVGALAVFVFAMSGSTSIFFLSRLLEGVGAAAIVPALLAYLTDATDGRPAVRARAMSYFELTLLAGLALGGVVAAELFRVLNSGAFTVASGGTLALSTGSSFTDAAGTLTVTGTLSELGGTFTQSGGTESGNPVALATATLAVSAGTGSFGFTGASTLTGTIPSGQTVRVEGTEYLVMREEDIMGVIE